MASEIVSNAALLLRNAYKFCDIAERRATDEILNAHFLPLSAELREWYLFGMPAGDIPWFAEDLTLFAPEDLMNAQDGYRFSGQSKVRLSTWPEDWIAIGSASGDPLIAHVDRLETPISIAMHGAGTWKPQPLAQSLATFLKVLALRIEICCGEFSMQLFDDDDELLEDVRNRLFAVAAPLVGRESAEIWAGRSWV